jgi:hypothetical protein
MASTRASLIGGAAHAVYASSNIHFADDSKLDYEKTTVDVDSQMFGKIDETDVDFLVHGSGTPLLWDNLTTLLPYLTPVFGSLYPLSADTPMSYKSSNGDIYLLTNAVITKMPDIFLGLEKPILGSMEWTGIIGDGLEPDAENAYYTVTTGQTYTPVAIDRSKIQRRKYTASYGAVAGFTSFEAEEGWTISHQLKIEPHKVQGRTKGFKLLGYNVMVSGKPIGPTGAQITAAMKNQGTGNYAGSRMSANTNSLIIAGSGSSAPSIQVNNCFIKKAGFMFGLKPIRNGEIGFVSINDPTTGTLGPVIVIS